MLSGSPPYVYIYVYIYTILSGRPHIHTYIYTLNPTTLPLSYHSSNSSWIGIWVDFFKNWDDRGSLERSLPVVNWDLNWFFLKLGWSGALRTLATGSECSKRERRSLPVRTLPKIDSVLTGCDGRSLLERSLPVVSVLRGGWQTSDQGWSCVFAGVLVRRTQDWGCSGDRKPPLERSLPVVSVLRGSDGRSLLERYLS